jgi:hypothetical protein
MCLNLYYLDVGCIYTRTAKCDCDVWKDAFMPHLVGCIMHIRSRGRNLYHVESLVFHDIRSTQKTKHDSTSISNGRVVWNSRVQACGPF